MEDLELFMVGKKDCFVVCSILKGNASLALSHAYSQSHDSHDTSVGESLRNLN